MDPDAVQRSLANAWGAELMLGFGSPLDLEDELVRLMNNWGVVQTYYSVYHAFQALLLAQRRARPQNHPSTQTQFAAQWTDRSLDLPPFSSAVGPNGFINDGLAPRSVDLNIQSWTTCEPLTCWSLVGKALRTTREKKLYESEQAFRHRARIQIKKAWNAKERERLSQSRKPRVQPSFPLPRMTKAERLAHEQKFRQFTLIDYLYRLRIRANYQDALMFTDGPTSADESARVRANLIALTASTMLVHEIHIGALVGKQTFMRWIDDWVGRNDPQELTLGLRRDILDASI
ncbi:MAG: hypothetical protein JHC98_02985 [Thermoleophilaceae bacterium]|nr:hypothetical protein [Thermoleophilaceae bacterium]